MPLRIEKMANEVTYQRLRAALTVRRRRRGKRQRAPPRPALSPLLLVLLVSPLWLLLLLLLALPCNAALTAAAAQLLHSVFPPAGPAMPEMLRSACLPACPPR